MTGLERRVIRLERRSSLGNRLAVLSDAELDAEIERVRGILIEMGTTPEELTLEALQAEPGR